MTDVCQVWGRQTSSTNHIISGVIHSFTNMHSSKQNSDPSSAYILEGKTDNITNHIMLYQYYKEEKDRGAREQGNSV